MSLILRIPPMAKPRMTQRDKIPALQSKQAQKYFTWKRELQWKLKQFGIKRIDNDGEVNCVFYIAMPQSWNSQKRKKMYATPHTQRPDIDNLIKALLDAVYQEDCKIYSIKALKKWAINSYIYVGGINDSHS